jgi:hypothetical protein
MGYCALAVAYKNEDMDVEFVIQDSEQHEIGPNQPTNSVDVNMVLWLPHGSTLYIKSSGPRSSNIAVVFSWRHLQKGPPNQAERVELAMLPALGHS